MLRVEYLGLSRIETEECGVEQVSVLQYGFCFYVMRVVEVCGRHTCGEQLVVRKERDCVGSCAQELPKLFNVRRTRKTSAHADDGDTFHMTLSRLPAHPPCQLLLSVARLFLLACALLKLLRSRFLRLCLSDEVGERIDSCVSEHFNY